MMQPGRDMGRLLRQQGGITLVEVLAGLVIMVLVIFLLFGIVFKLKFIFPLPQNGQAYLQGAMLMEQVEDALHSLGQAPVVEQDGIPGGFVMEQVQQGKVINSYNVDPATIGGVQGVVINYTDSNGVQTQTGSYPGFSFDFDNNVTGGEVMPGSTVAGDAPYGFDVTYTSTQLDFKLHGGSATALGYQHNP